MTRAVDDSSPGLRFRDVARMGRWLAGDAFRYFALPWAAPGAAEVLKGLYGAERHFSRSGALRLLLASHRLHPSDASAHALNQALRGAGEALLALMPDDVAPERAAERTVVLRPPRMDGSRLIPGVILVKFTETLRYYAHHVDRVRLQRYFRVILEPSWTGYAVPEILQFHDADQSIVVESSEVRDRGLLRALGGALVPVPLGSGGWVDHRVFRPLGLTRSYGAVYVANYTKAKRVPSFLQAVRKVLRSGRSFRAALVCARWGGSRESVLPFLDALKVRSAVDVYESLDHEQLNVVLNRSRSCVLLSRREGSNRSLFEAMFAGTPAILLAENVGVNRDSFVPATGAVVPERHLPEAMVRVSESFDAFSPREWATRHISPEASTALLRGELQRLFPQDGDGALLLKINAPEATYFEDSLRPFQIPTSRTLLHRLRPGVPDPGVDAMLAAVEPLAREADLL